MGTCSVCRAEDREAVDRALVAGQSLRDIARQSGLSRSSLARHRANHLRGPVAAEAARRGLTVGDLAASLVEAHRHVQAVVRDAAGARGDRRLLLLAVRELRADVEVLAKLAGLMSHRVEVTAGEPVPMETQRERAASVLAVLHSAGVLRLAPGSGEPGGPDEDEDDGDGWPGELAAIPASPADPPEETGPGGGFPAPPPPLDPLAAYPWLREDGVADLRNHF